MVASRHLPARDRLSRRGRSRDAAVAALAEPLRDGRCRAEGRGRRRATPRLVLAIHLASRDLRVRTADHDLVRSRARAGRIGELDRQYGGDRAFDQGVRHWPATDWTALQSSDLL